MKPIVSIAPYSTGAYASLVQTGLYDLRAEGLIDLRISGSILPPCPKGLPNPASVFIQVQHEKADSDKRLFFDFIDGGGIAGPELLKSVDVYYKRSYHPGIIEQLPKALRERVRPFGLHYACTSANQTVLDKWRYQSEHVKLVQAGKPKYHDIRPIGNALGHTASHALSKYWNPKTLGNRPPLIKEIECSSRAAAEPKIFYRTRVYAPTEKNFVRGATENETRVAVIRALKKEFGNRFVGGLRRSTFAEKHYPDCIFPFELNWHQHLKLVRKYQIAVTTAGLFDSTDWKLAEYLAASRCTVSERLRYDLSVPLIEEKDIISFDTPEQCVAACDRILQSSSLAQSLRENASEYYKNFLSPRQIMRRVLDLPLRGPT